MPGDIVPYSAEMRMAEVARTDESIAVVGGELSGYETGVLYHVPSQVCDFIPIKVYSSFSFTPVGIWFSLR